jgi:GNAT superfamily N-acetyltransferase
MAEIQVRPATADDLPRLVQFDHGYSTDYVWQMDLRDDGGTGEIQVGFRPVRLPRPMRVSYTRDPERLTADWTRRVCFLVAEQDGVVKGYLNLVLAPAAETGWIVDCVVERRFRRAGVGSVLLAAGAQWSRANRLKRLVLEMQSKNYPASTFAQKHGLVFCGYNDRYYPNQDVALFFGMTLK